MRIVVHFPHKAVPIRVLAAHIEDLLEQLAQEYEVPTDGLFFEVKADRKSGGSR